MSALYPSLEDMKVDHMAQVCLCLHYCKLDILSVACKTATTDAEYSLYFLVSVHSSCFCCCCCCVCVCVCVCVCDLRLLNILRGM